MRLSDAMALGRTLIEFQKYTLLSDDGTKGCALGAVLKSIGHQGGAKDYVERIALYNKIMNKWPWLRSSDMIEDIYSKFDSLVMNGKMTFDELIDYVRANEPEEILVDTASVEEVEYASMT